MDRKWLKRADSAEILLKRLILQILQGIANSALQEHFAEFRGDWNMGTFEWVWVIQYSYFTQV